MTCGLRDLFWGVLKQILLVYKLYRYVYVKLVLCSGLERFLVWVGSAGKRETQNTNFPCKTSGFPVVCPHLLSMMLCIFFLLVTRVLKDLNKPFAGGWSKHSSFGKGFSLVTCHQKGLINPRKWVILINLGPFLEGLAFLLEIPKALNSCTIELAKNKKGGP